LSARLNTRLLVHDGKKMLATLVENFVCERWVNVCNGARKQQCADHLTEQCDRLSAAAFTVSLRLFDSLGESIEVRREPICVRAARHIAEPAGVADKTRQGATRLDIRAMFG
jgi:hypothetical protein